MPSVFTTPTPAGLKRRPATPPLLLSYGVHMTVKSLIKKLNLSDSDFAAIKDAVASAESKTTGEIAVAVAAESGKYSFWELLWSNGLAAVVLAVMIPFSAGITSIFQKFYWDSVPAWIVPCVFVAAAFAIVVMGFYLCNITAIDRMIIPDSEKTKTVSARAMQHFSESGVYNTKEHSGILIFVSYMEREVRIVADSGISSKISQDLWNLIADELCENLKKGDTVKAFTGAIEKCGDLLAENFPNHEENPNELSDGLVIIED